jgi:hypothetical protein
MDYGKKSMRGAQGPMAQNRPKGDGLAKESAAHEACESKDNRDSMHAKSMPKPMKQKGGDSDREGGY